MVVGVSYGGLWGWVVFEDVLDDSFGSRLLGFISQMTMLGAVLGLAAHIQKQSLQQSREIAHTLLDTQAQHEATLNALPNVMVEVDPHGRILDYRAPTRSSLHLSPQSFLYKRFSEVLPGDASAVIAEALDEAKNSGRSGGAIYPLQMEEGGKRWFELSVATKETQDKHMIALVRDVTPHVESEQQLKGDLKETAVLARTDDLTGLLNRRAILEMAEAEFDRARRQDNPVGLFLVDMFKLKEINDTHGHLAGDAALILLAQVLREKRRRYDWVGRWGGDEFVVVLPGVNYKKALHMAERLLEQVQKTYVSLPDGGEEQLRVSVGVSSSEDHGETNITLEELLLQADMAMNRAKETGPNTAGVYPVK